MLCDQVVHSGLDFAPPPISMYTSLQQHRRDQSSRANDNEKDEDLFLFQEMQKREREALNESVALPLHRETPAIARVAEDIFSSSEWDTHDYDW